MTDAELKEQMKMGEVMREELASVIHEIWAHWTKYMLDNDSTSHIPDGIGGGVHIYKEAVDRWQRQIKTHYRDLSEKEKDSDREQVGKLMPVIAKWLQFLVQERTKRQQECLNELTRTTIPLITKVGDTTFVPNMANGTCEEGGSMTLSFSAEEWTRIARKQRRNGEKLTTTLKRMAGLEKHEDRRSNSEVWRQFAERMYASRGTGSDFDFAVCLACGRSQARNPPEKCTCGEDGLVGYDPQTDDCPQAVKTFDGQER